MDRLEMKKQVVEISGDRNLYNYTFSLDGEGLEPQTPVTQPEPQEDQP